MTRAQAKSATQKTRPLHVEQSQTIGAIGHKKLENAQKADDPLKKWFESANQKVFGKDDHSSIEGGILFLNKWNVKDAKWDKRVLVHVDYRNEVMGVAHQSITGGHLGPQKTLDRVVGQFYWPGIGTEIARYCKSCDICQRTLPQGKTKKKSTIRRNALNVIAISPCCY